MSRFLQQLAEAELPVGKYVLALLLNCCFTAFCFSQEHLNQFRHLVESDVRAYYAELDHRVDRVRIEVKLPNRLTHSTCNTMAVSRIPAHATPIKKVRYEIRCEGTEKYRGYANIKVWTPVLVATRQLDVGDQIGTDEVTMMSTELSQLRTGFVTHPNQILGFEVKRKIRQHQAVTFPFLIAPTLVTRGEIATLQAGGNGFIASVKVEVLKNGRQGELIEVRNLSSNKILQARVIGKNLLKSEN